MSADNYVVVRKFDDGWRWAMGYASSDIQELPDEEFRNGPFDCPFDAQDDAEKQCGFIEYGIETERPKA